MLDIASVSQEAIVSGFALAALSTAGLVVLWRKHAEKKRQLEHCKESLMHLQEGFYRSSLDGRQLSANPALVRLNGYRSEAEQLASVSDIGTEWYVEPGRRDEFKQQLFEHGKVSSFVSQVYRHKTREPIWISENARLVCDPLTGEPLYYEGTVREITNEMRLNETRDRLHKLANNLPGGLFQIGNKQDGKPVIQFMSGNFVKMFELAGVPDRRVLGHICRQVEESDLARYDQAFLASAQDLSVLDEQIRYKRKNGETVWIHVTATPERRDDGSTLWHGHAIDITEQKNTEQRYQHLANFDALTGLPRRATFDERLAATVSACDRRGEYAAILFLDLDNFKQLNDSAGHKAGDELLRQVGERLKSQMRACDMIARFGGDEFVALVDNLGEDEAIARDKAGQIATKVLGTFTVPFRLEDREHFASPSIGVAIIHPKGASKDVLLANADSAMYQAKRNGRNTYVIHDERRATRDSAAGDYLDDLKEAVSKKQFRLVYQPQIDANGRIAGAEAFIRWEHPLHGMIAPSDFMPFAEKNGLLPSINDWVLTEAINRLAEWQANQSLRHLDLAVNLSIQQFAVEDFGERLERLLAASGIQRRKLILELPESLLSRSPEAIAERMRSIKKSGIRFSLDDFGTGSASLSNLSLLPVDEIKIEGLLVSAMEKDEFAKTMIAGIIGIASALKLSTVAEHVSSPLQHAYLHDKGCNRFQGYHFHPPLELDDFTAEVIASARNKSSKLAS